MYQMTFYDNKLKHQYQSPFVKVLYELQDTLPSFYNAQVNAK